MAGLRGKLGGLAGSEVAGLTVAAADDYAYDDPVDGSRTEAQGIRVEMEGGGRIVYRLSGTGTVGATLRVYLEQLETDPARLGLDPEEALGPVIAAAEAIAGIERHTGRTKPDVTT